MQKTQLALRKLMLTALLLAAGTYCIGQTYSKTITVSGDSYVNSNTADSGRYTNYGTSTQLRFRYSQSSSSSVYNLITYLRFNLNDLNLPYNALVDSVSLGASVYYSQSGSGHVWHALRVTDTTWTETGINWNNKPALGSDTLGTVPKPAGTISEAAPYRATWRGILPAYSAAKALGNKFSLAIYTRLNSSANTSAYSREHGVDSLRPKLTVYYHLDSVVTPTLPQAESRKHNLNLIYFLPTDVDTVVNYRQRLNGIMLAAQNFYRKWMNHWGYTGETFGLNKESNGMVKLTIINGLYDKTHYPYEGGGSLIIPEINAYYAAHPEEKTSSHYLVLLPEMGYNPFYGLGRYCFALDNPNIDTNYVGSSNYIGGLVHELGHGLNLPHDKEKVSEKANPAMGTALMGSGNTTYMETPTFLTAVECATLHVSETFRSEDTIADLYGGGTSTFTSFHSSYSGGNIILSGRYTATKNVSSILAYNDNNDDGANYDQVGWVTNLVGSDSFFVSMPVAELWKKYGTYTLRMRFLFTNGSSRDITYPYSFVNNLPVIDIDFQPMSRPAGITPVADTYIRNGSYVTTNYGNDSSMTVKPDPASGFTREMFLKFRLSDYGGTLANVNSVKLAVKVTGVNSGAGGTKLYARWLNKTNWDNSSHPLTWNSYIADSSHVDSLYSNYYYGGGWMIWDLSRDTLLSSIQRGDTAITIHISGVYSGSGAGTSDLSFASSEASAGNRPSLMLTEGSSLLSGPLAVVRKAPLAATIYPNPSSSVVYVRSGIAGKAILYNSSGTPVLQVMLDKNGNNEVDVKHLPAGIYYLKMEKGGGTALTISVVK
ncbi:DNRLRE domain-containing protein [uncultured Chitinophaga sp.]|uniref:CBM96 family carbohydrate-binding protein n=1 Tax=uncultured Chitinophaga sp. TaxID=339340 RepID=UPI0025EE406E|nr:DNRLRE domain-containing protein [uncultured Chitinophaga sp.]